MPASAQIDVGGILRPQGRPDLSTALQPFRGALGERAAAHLLRRAGFGGNPGEIRRYSAMHAGDAVASLLALPSPDAVRAPAELDDRAQAPMMSMATKQERFRQRRDVVLAMQLWWLNRMLTTPAPLQEKMTLYFHGHFTSRATPLFPWITYNQNALFRSYALGNLRELTRNVSKDAAMLVYLNGAENVAAHPNENYARELMELFTLGIGNYTEADVRESARAWTGWRVYRRTGTVTFDPALHDSGAKRSLGARGNFTGDDVVDIIFAQPAVRAVFRRRACSAGSSTTIPSRELVDAVAQLLRKHDFELAPVVATILSSNVFYSDARLSRAGEEPGRVRGRHATRRWACRRSTRAALPALRADGSTPLLSAERRRLAGRRRTG